ncbi:hypothetical protein KC8_19055 [Sphingomonas sp. KC8]|nr:hypothetical protein KC8_19055 [Sphingomonas sp. KC8]
MSDPILPSDLDDRVIARFRAWGVADPILTKKRASEGGWTHSERPRTASTVEESVIQLKAALNHAVPRFLPSAPVLKHLTRDQVTAPRDFRLSEEMLARMLDYTAAGGGKYAGHPARLLPLRRYLIAAISTLDRPDAIMDMSVLPARKQWRANQMIFDLNPSGRIQTRKRRAALPIPAMLDRWLRETDNKFVCREVIRRSSDGDEWIEQVPVASVKKAWQGMARDMDIPSGWGPKLIRYSVATIIAEKRVDMAELEIALGHSPVKRTTARYTTFRPAYLASVRSCIAALWDELERLCEHPLHANLTQVGEDGRRRRL